jgi:hypothetical protein
VAWTALGQCSGKTPERRVSAQVIVLDCQQKACGPARRELVGMNMTWARLVVGVIAALVLLFVLWSILQLAGHGG